MPLYMDAEDRREVLRQYGKDFGLRVFIETGTNAGDTPAALLDDFDSLFTIELDKRLFSAASARFRKIPKVTCLYGDSTQLLPIVLKKIDDPALVWLDGHHSGPGTARGELDTPVVQELYALFSHGLPHVILVDDARIFEGQPEHHDEPHYADYPSCEWVEEVANDNGYDFELKDDIMRLTPCP